MYANCERCCLFMNHCRKRKKVSLNDSTFISGCLHQPERSCSLYLNVKPKRQVIAFLTLKGSLLLAENKVPDADTLTLTLVKPFACKTPNFAEEIAYPIQFQKQTSYITSSPVHRNRFANSN